MPRAKSSTIAKIVAFFNTEPLAIAEIALDLAKDAVRRRQEPTPKAKPHRARRKVTTASPPPVNEAKPIAPAPPAAAAPQSATQRAYAPAARRPRPPAGPRRAAQEAESPLLGMSSDVAPGGSL